MLRASLRALPTELQSFVFLRPLSTLALHPGIQVTQTDQPRTYVITERIVPAVAQVEDCSSFLEPKTEEYNSRLFRSSIPSLQLSHKPSHRLLQSLKEGDERGAVLLLNQYIQAGHQLDKNSDFLPFACHSLQNGSMQRFLLWFSLVPVLPQQYLLKREHLPKEYTDAFQSISRSLTNHYEQTEDVQKFCFELAERGMLPYFLRPLKELATRAKPGDFNSLVHSLRVKMMSLLTEAKIDEPISVLNQELKKQRASLVGLLLRYRCRAGYLKDVAECVLQAYGPKMLQNPSQWISTIRFLLPRVLATLQNNNLSDEDRKIYQKLSTHLQSAFIANLPKDISDANLADELVALQPVSVPSSTLKPIRYHDLANKPLWNAKMVIKDFIEKHSIYALSPQSLAGLISAYCDKHGSTDIQSLSYKLGIQELIPSTSAIDPVRRLWISAYLAYLQKSLSPSKRPAEILNYFHQYCLPVGIPSRFQLYEFTSMPGKNRVLPKKDMLRCVFSALVDHYATTSYSISEYRSKVQELYREFLQMVESNNLPSYLAADAKMFQSFFEAFAFSPFHSLEAKELGYQCLNILQDMQRVGLQPSLHNWTSTVAALAFQPDPTLVFDILNRMEDASAEVLPESVTQSFAALPSPSFTTYYLIMNGFRAAQLPSLARKVQFRMVNFLGVEEVHREYEENSNYRRLLGRLAALERDRAGNVEAEA